MATLQYIQRKQKEWSGVQADQRIRDRSNYPASPSAGKGILAKYEEFIRVAIEGKKQWSACILGATPELRDMVLARGATLTTIDISREMFEKCTPLMKHRDDPREYIVIENWLENSLPSHAYDLVLGDGVSNNIPYDDQERFFQELYRIIKPKGTLILREATVNPMRTRRTVKAISDTYDRGECHWFDVFIDCYFYSTLTDQCRDAKTGKSEMTKLWPLIEDAHKRGELSRKAFDAMWWFRGNLVHTFLNRPVFEQFISAHFELQPATQATDYTFTQDTLLFFVGKPKSL